MASLSGSRVGGGPRVALFDELASSATASIHVGRLTNAAGVARTVAVYKLYPRFAKDPEFVATFLDETRLAARVQHPNVVPTLDVVKDGSDVLLATELIAGESLAHLAESVRATGERLDPRVACAVVVGALRGLHAAHEAKNEFSESLGIVHGDFSHENILVGTDGVARLIGFGIAKALDRMRPTSGPPMRSKRPTMAPEQVRGSLSTRATDVWGASVVLWEVLTGEPLFPADDDAGLSRAVLGMPIRDPSALSSALPPALDAITRRGLDRDPRRRFATAGEMADAIEQALPWAPPKEIATLLDRACGKAIADRRERIRAVESAPTRGASATRIVPSSEFIADALWGGQGEPKPPDPSRPEAPPSRSPPAVEVAQVQAKAPSPRATRASVAKRWGIGAAKLAVLALIVTVASVFAVPGYAKRRAIETAGARGVSVTIDDATGGFGGVTFRGVTASIADVPGARVTLAELEIELHWLRPERATLRHVEVSLDGPFSKTLALATRWYRSHEGDTQPALDTGEGVRVVVPSVHVVWSRAFGEDSRIEAGDVTGELVPASSNRIGDEFQFTTSKLTVRTQSGTLGPWRIDLDRDPDALNARVAFDPPVPDGPSARITRMTTGQTSVEVNIPRSPLLRIGIPPAVLARFHQVPEQAEIHLHYARTAEDHVDATLAATLFGLHAPPVAGTVDLNLAGSIAGNAGGPLDLQGGVLNLGPVRATLSGPVAIQDGVRASLRWKAAPIPCAQLLPKSDRAANDLAGQLDALRAGGGDLASLGIDVTSIAQSVGLARVSGNLSVSGTLMFDSSDLAGTAFSATGSNSCGISLFTGR